MCVCACVLAYGFNCVLTSTLINEHMIWIGNEIKSNAIHFDFNQFIYFAHLLTHSHARWINDTVIYYSSKQAAAIIMT